MKKFLSFLIICFVASSLKSAFAFDHSMVFGGISVGEDMSYGNLGVITAFNRNLEKNGSLLRVSAGYNNYNYSTTTRSINSNISDSDLMFGHQFVAEDSKIILFGGANYSDSGVSRFDMNNRAAGGKVGAKGQFEMYLVPMRDVFSVI